MNILLFAKLSDKKLYSKVKPLADSNKIDKIFLVRHSPLKINKVLSYVAPAWIRSTIFKEIFRLLTGFRILITRKVDIVWGIHIHYHAYLACFFSKLCKKKFILPFTNDPRFVFKSPFSFLHKTIVKSADLLVLRGSRAKDYFGFLTNITNVAHIPNLYEFQYGNIDRSIRKRPSLYRQY